MAQILLIDDNELFRSIIKIMLESEKHHVGEASNGEEGIDLFIAEEPTIIITDILMPTCDGLEFLQAISAISHTVPVICMSGGISGDVSWILPLTKTFGAMRFLRKPFGNAELLAMVEGLFTQSAALAV